jgi:hypothetical protein
MTQTLSNIDFWKRIKEYHQRYDITDDTTIADYMDKMEKNKPENFVGYLPNDLVLFPLHTETDQFGKVCFG